MADVNPMKKFSILVAHYNNFNYFKECYHSIQKQSYQNYELILVDDCSSDGSFEKIKEFVTDDEKVKVFQNNINLGVGGTKNRCVSLATGDFCAFVDPDDAIVDSAIEEVMNLYSSEKIVAVYSQLMMCGKDLKPVKIFKPSRQIKNGNPLFFNIFLDANHFFSFRKSAYDKTIGINPSLSSAVDQDLYLKLYETGDFKFLKKPLYFYRMHEKGVSQDKTKKEKLKDNLNLVFSETLLRRGIKNLYGKQTSEIEDLSSFIYQNQNSFINKVLRKIQ